MTKSIFFFLLIILSYSSYGNIDEVVKSVFDKYTEAKSLELIARISYFDTSDLSSPLHSNKVVIRTRRPQFFMESFNDLIQSYDGEYYMSIGLKDSHILIIKNDTFRPKLFDIGGFINFIKEHQAELVVLSRDMSIVKIGINTPDMPNDIITFSIDTTEKRLISYSMRKEYYEEENGLKTVFIRLDYLSESLNIKQEKLTEQLYYIDNKSKKVIWNSRFKNFTKEYYN